MFSFTFKYKCKFPCLSATHLPWKVPVPSPCPLVWLVSKCLLSGTAAHQWAETWSSPRRSDLPSQLRNEPLKAVEHSISFSIYFIWIRGSYCTRSGDTDLVWSVGHQSWIQDWVVHVLVELGPQLQYFIFPGCQQSDQRTLTDSTLTGGSARREQL